MNFVVFAVIDKTLHASLALCADLAGCAASVQCLQQLTQKRCMPKMLKTKH